MFFASARLRTVRVAAMPSAERTADRHRATFPAHPRFFPSPALGFTLYSPVPAAAPSNIGAAARTARSLAIAWDLVPLALLHGPRVAQNLSIVRSGDSDDIHGGASAAAYVALPGNATSYTVEGLLPYTTYEIRLAAKTNAGQGPWSQPAAITTRSAAPAVSPPDLRVERVAATSAAVSWNDIPPLQRNGAVFYAAGAFATAMDDDTCARIQCVSQDQCQAVACVLDQCVHTPLVDNTPCDDGNAATRGDVCIGGSCVGTST